MILKNTTNNFNAVTKIGTKTSSAAIQHNNIHYSSCAYSYTDPSEPVFEVTSSL